MKALKISGRKTKDAWLGREWPGVIIIPQIVLMILIWSPEQIKARKMSSSLPVRQTSEKIYAKSGVRIESAQFGIQILEIG